MDGLPVFSSVMPFTSRACRFPARKQDVRPLYYMLIFSFDSRAYVRLLDGMIALKLDFWLIYCSGQRSNFEGRA
jgi:hypothetical protein